MPFHALADAIRTHRGEFLCRSHGDATRRKIVPFRHLIEAPDAATLGGVPAVGGLDGFYAVCNSVTFYHDETSGEAVRHIGPPEEWWLLEADFQDWVADFSDDELPEWLPDARVIGEAPEAALYILVATTGEHAGQIFEFDHDGCEFRHMADDILAYVKLLLQPDGALLTNFASTMRFSTDDTAEQWWIVEMRDSRGHVARTDPEE